MYHSNLVKFTSCPQGWDTMRPKKSKISLVDTYFCDFHPDLWGRFIQFDEHIFQMGWFNHQPEMCMGIWIFVDVGIHIFIPDLSGRCGRFVPLFHHLLSRSDLGVETWYVGGSRYINAVDPPWFVKDCYFVVWEVAIRIDLLALKLCGALIREFGHLLQNDERIPFEGNNGFMPKHSMYCVYIYIRTYIYICLQFPLKNPNVGE